ncbi:hypothetical protein [Niabella sp.]|uniref:hypothetical protein n=1 Tax=Niabella sp. TaxID=1962976 RepID=UPI002639268B|nr:hypothetical protein [Niabella sp.]
MRKQHFLKAVEIRSGNVAAQDVRNTHNHTEMPADARALTGSARLKRMTGRITGWYRSLLRRRPDRGAGAE